MTEVLHSSPSPSSSSSSLPTPTHNETLFQTQSLLVEEEEEELGGISRVCTTNDCDDDEVKERDKDRRDQLSLLALLVTLFRKSFWVACKTDREELCGMEIGWPTDVQHVAHVTFDRFNGFLGLPVEFEPEVPSRAPSASTTVFGVSTESMQLAYDHRGNSVPTILLLMQQRLYDQGGLQAEGIFRINAENGQEEYVRNQLNTGIVPQGIDVHCLAGLIKAWFREMPSGVLDPLSPERLMQCETEEHCSELVRLLPPTESALLNWAINLMTDVVQHEHLNKMNAHNIAMVFAPNMTQMADPLNALMYAVRVMNFLKALITKTLREREDSVIEPSPLTPLDPDPDPSDENGHQGPLQPLLQDPIQETEKSEPSFIPKEPNSDTSNGNNTDEEFLGSTEESDEGGPTEASVMNSPKTPVESDQSSESNQSKLGQQLLVQEMGTIEKSKGLSNLSRINSRTERIEAWR